MTTQPGGTRFLNQTPHGYSNVVELTGGKLIVVTGQMARDADGNIVGGDSLRAQTEQVFKNLQDQLAVVGADFSHVVKLSILAVDGFAENAVEFAEVRDQFVNTANPPASGIILVSRLVQPGALIDIAVEAHLPG